MNRQPSDDIGAADRGVSRRPPARAILDAGAGVEHGHLTPADTETNIDIGGQGQSHRQCGVDRVADRRIAAMELVADGECQRSSGQDLGDAAMQPAPVGRLP